MLFNNHEELFIALLNEETVEKLAEPGVRVKLIDGFLVGTNGAKWEGIGHPSRYRLVKTKEDNTGIIKVD